jgi:5S rRNA maturation endonuclease (ribonuclease M5)
LADPYLDNTRLNVLQRIVCDRLDELFDSLGVALERGHRYYVGACPIHGGDNPLALNLYHGGHTSPGTWRCYTRGCERHFKRTIFGFVRGVLSHQKYDWSPGDRNMVPWRQAIDHCCRVVGQDIAHIAVDQAEEGLRRYARQIAVLTLAPRESRPTLSRKDVLGQLAIPSSYFVGRGWSKEVLVRFDVGDCVRQGRYFSGRAVVPIYDRNGNGVVGLTGRSTYARCETCRMWHKGPCPTTPEERRAACKWRNSSDFSVEDHLYNWWGAQTAINQQGKVVLCEGPGDVWRCVEAGIDNAVAAFGANLSDRQQVRLEASGAMEIIVPAHSDEAGRKWGQDLQNRLGRSFRVSLLALPKKDLGEMAIEEVREMLVPRMKKAT